MDTTEIYRHSCGYDFELDHIGHFVAFIEWLTKNKFPFAVYQKTTGFQTDSVALSQDLRANRPLIGYGGKYTFPFISDPDDIIQGAFGIINKNLIYSPNACPLHHMRDSYTWAFSEPQYYTLGNFIEVVSSFIDVGYGLLQSPNMIDYRTDKGISIKISGPILLTDIFGTNTV